MKQLVLTRNLSKIAYAGYSAIREPGGESAILYPTTDPKAEEAWIEVKDPVADGGGRGRVVLRPANLYKL